MSDNSEYLTYLIDQFAPFGHVTARSMFGGIGLFHQKLMFGLVADDVIYLKVDDQNRSEFEDAGLAPFIYYKGDKPFSLGYYQMPDTAMDDTAELVHWARSGYDAAVRADRKKPPSKRKQS